MSNTVWIGYDPREKIAYDVAEYSIHRHNWPTNKTVVTIALELDDVRGSGLLTRPVEMKDGRMWCPISQAPMATEFAISRFCVPFLHKDGWALFVDCDILCLSNINELFALADDKYAVMVVKHKQQMTDGVHGINGDGFLVHSECDQCRAIAMNPKTHLKMDNQLQTFYARKNWSSVMLINASHPANKRLTLEALNTWPGRDLHAFKWLKDEEIGELPLEWNYLVGVSPKVERPKLIHFTLGIPTMPGYENCEFADEWRREFGKMTCNES